jgi:membrane protein DedA with SNARE-associated domain
MSWIESIVFFLRETLAPDKVIELVGQLGEAILFLFAFIEVVPPLSFFSPGGLAIIAGGAFIKDIPTAFSYFMAAWLGLIVGNTLFFWLGRHFGRSVAHRFYLTEDRLKTVDEFMQRFGRISVLFGQFIGGVRPFVSFIAGTTPTNPWAFFLWMTTGCAGWAATSLTLGYFLREHITIVLSSLTIVGILLFSISMIFVFGAEKSIAGKKKQEPSKELPKSSRKKL